MLKTHLIALQKAGRHSFSALSTHSIAFSKIRPQKALRKICRDSNAKLFSASSFRVPSTCVGPFKLFHPLLRTIVYRRFSTDSSELNCPVCHRRCCSGKRRHIIKLQPTFAPHTIIKNQRQHFQLRVCSTRRSVGYRCDYSICSNR